MSQGRLPLLRSIGLVAAFAAREVSWSRKTIFLALLLLVPATIATLIRSHGQPGEIGQFLENALPSLTIFVLQFVCLFHAAGLVRDAMEDRTLAFLLTRPIGRVRVVLGLYVGLIAYLIPLGLISVTAGFCACRVGLPEGVFAGEMGAAFPALLGVTALAVVFYGALHTLFGLAFKAPTILGLVFVMIVDGLLGSLQGPPRRMAPMAYFESMLPGAFKSRATEDVIEPDPIEPLIAIFAIIAAWIAILLIIRFLTRGKDFVAFQKTQ